MEIVAPFSRIASNVKLGKNIKFVGYANIYGCEIGDGCMIGPFVEIQKGVRVGRLVKIQSHTFICEGVTIDDEVFIGHGVKFINDRFPRATTLDGRLKDDNDWKLIKTIIHRRASIGSGSILMCGISVGSGAIVGAGAVVTKDIPEGQIWVGNPARYLRDIRPEEE